MMVDVHQDVGIIILDTNVLKNVCPNAKHVPVEIYALHVNQIVFIKTIQSEYVIVQTNIVHRKMEKHALTAL